jgi:redox-sensing transcriptional repressor
VDTLGRAEGTVNADKIPDIIIGRLPLYLRALQQMGDRGMKTTSSQELGDYVGISAAQIRKDISQFGEFGKQGTGYSIPFLIEKLREILKVNRMWDVVVVGVGDVGHALARYAGFAERGFRVAMIFDVDPSKVGTPVGEFIIEDAGTLVERVRSAHIKLAMIAVPATAAQQVRAILNYAPTVLSVPDGVHLQHIDPATHLQRMTFYLDGAVGAPVMARMH